MAKDITEIKAELEQKLGQLVMQVSLKREELQKLQAETDETATAIKKLNE